MVSLVNYGALVLLLLVYTVVTEKYTLKELDLTFYALDLNITLLWNHLDVTLSENETIYYTVFHHIRADQDVPVPRCINITETSCSLNHLFPTGSEFNINEHFKVGFFSNARAEIHGKSGVMTFSNRYNNISGPVIENTDVNARNVTVWVHGPLTPFVVDNITLFIGDRRVGRRLYLRDLYFTSTLSYRDDPSDSVRSIEWTRGYRNGTCKFTYTGLTPYTNYVFRSQNRFGRDKNKKEKAVESLELRTTQEGPEFSPYITHHEITRHSCDMRDIRLVWEERKELRSNVEISHYVIICEDKKSGEKTETIILASSHSTVIYGLYRWTELFVTVQSVNSEGNATSENHIIPFDDTDEDSYEITNINISKESSTVWQLTWDPPSKNVECIIGYNVSTLIDGVVESEFYLRVVTSISLRFKRIGRYFVDLVPVVNNSRGITKITTIRYNATDLKLREWAILASVVFLMLVTLIAVMVMTRKVCCDVSALPDFSKTLSVRLASSRDEFVESLKSPPEKEFFHATRTSYISPTVKKRYDDHVISEPKTTSPYQLVTSGAPSKYKDGITPTEANDSHNKSTSDSTYRQEKNDTVEAPPTITHISGVIQSDGYVSHSLSAKTSLTVYIPKESHFMKSGPMSPQSSSADSGISSSAYTGSVSDYVPASPFSDFDTSGDTSSDTCFSYDVEGASPYVKSTTVYGNDINDESPYIKHDIACNSDSYGYDFKSNSPYVKSATVQSNVSVCDFKIHSPYVKSEFAGQPGWVQSTSEPSYFSAAESSTHLKGYLPMSPSAQSIDRFEEYSKLSPKT